jgi:bilirubin oxidase
MKKNLLAAVLLIPGANVLFAQAFNNPLAIPPLITGQTFNLVAHDTSTQFYPNITTLTKAYNGTYLGPTLEMVKGDSVTVNLQNDLAENTTLHLHGMHVPAVSDGGPQMLIAPNTFYSTRFKVMNDASTCWYHPHVHMNTESQVNSGLAGMILVRDSDEAALPLPRTYGVDDFPVVLQDRSYDFAGNMYLYALADSMLVNGTPNPYLDCPQQVVRLRLLNGSNARNYNIGFSDNRNFWVIASDGGLLEQPFQANRLVISAGERYEILVDFGSDAISSSVFMKSYATAFANTEPGGGGMQNGTRVLNAVDFNIMKLNVVAPTSSPVTTIPSSLISFTPLNPTNAVRTRTKTLAGMGMFDMGNFNISGAQYDMQVINDTVLLNTIEVWHISNTSTVAHPFHIHDVPFYIHARNGNTPPAWEQGLKDVVYLKNGENVDLIMQFSDFANDTLPYMYHCHNLAHEDMGMMAQFLVIDPMAGIPATENTGFPHAWPNPSASSWTILNDVQAAADYQLTDITGKTVMGGKIAAGDASLFIDGTNLPAGIYFLTVIRANEAPLVIRLVRN